MSAIRERLEGVLIAASSAIKAPFYLARLRKLRLICFCFFLSRLLFFMMMMMVMMMRRLSEKRQMESRTALKN